VAQDVRNGVRVNLFKKARGYSHRAPEIGPGEALEPLLEPGPGGGRLPAKQVKQVGDEVHLEIKARARFSRFFHIFYSVQPPFYWLCNSDIMALDKVRERTYIIIG
jgi:hypothetical protein